MGEAWSRNRRAVLALAVFDDGTQNEVYAGGEFTMAGAVVANSIAKWDGPTGRPSAAG